MANRTATGDCRNNANIPLLYVITCNTLFAIAVGSILTLFIMKRISRKNQLRHERERICSLMHRLYWLHEEDISASLFVLNKMRECYLFENVSELLVFSHKYRIYGLEMVAAESDLSCLPPKRNFNKLLLTVRKVERLFEALTMELPCGNNGADGSISSAVGGTILMLALATSTLWCDSRAKMIRFILFL